MAAGQGGDAFLSWLRGEFAAANAIIDLLLLARARDGEEEDGVAAAVQRRRHHWAPVLHLQHYFPVTEVALALQQHAAAARQRRCPAPTLLTPHPTATNPARRHGGQAHQRSDGGAERDGSVALSEDCKSVKKEVETLGEATESIPHATEAQPQKGLRGTSKVVPVPSRYVVNEVIDDKTVNVLEGLKLYKGFMDVTEVGKILSFVNEVKAMRREAGLEGQTVVVAKRPLKGHGKEFIQLGLPITEGPPEDVHLRGEKVDPVPAMLHDLFDRLVHLEVVPAKPDYCVIDFFDEGDYSHPYHPPPWYGRPFCTLCLTDCDMVFGHVIAADSQGDHRGPLKLSLSTGSVLVLEGKSADIAKRALPTARKQRILLSFGKSVVRKHVQSESSLHITPPLTPPPMPWGPTLRPWNIPSHSLSPKQFGFTPSNGVLAVPTIGPHQIPSDGMQTVFIAPAPVTPKAIPLPNTTAPWMAEAAPRPAPPRFPFQGTGVFLPPGSCHPPPPSQKLGVPHADAEPSFPQESSASQCGISARVHKANGNVPFKPPRKVGVTEPVCNGSSDGGSSFAHDKAVVTKEEQNIATK